MRQLQTALIPFPKAASATQLPNEAHLAAVAPLVPWSLCHLRKVLEFIIFQLECNAS